KSSITGEFKSPDGAVTVSNLNLFARQRHSTATKSGRPQGRCCCRARFGRPVLGSVRNFANIPAPRPLNERLFALRAWSRDSCRFWRRQCGPAGGVPMNSAIPDLELSRRRAIAASRSNKGEKESTSATVRERDRVCTEVRAGDTQCATGKYLL